MQSISLQVSNRIIDDLKEVARVVKRPYKSLAKGLLEDAIKRGGHILLTGTRRTRKK